jgi:DNA polymerase-3 subunit delta'
MARLCAGHSLEQWVQVWENVRHLVAKADAVNLDRKQVLVSLFSTLEKAVKSAA